MTKEFWRATAIRCIRTFLTTILAGWSAEQLITTVDWRYTLIAAASATVYIFILCLIAGLPEVDAGLAYDEDTDDARSDIEVKASSVNDAVVEYYGEGDEDE